MRNCQRTIHSSKIILRFFTNPAPLTMGILFFSDLHGSAQAVQFLRRQIDLLRPERIAFLGDSLSPERSPAAIAFLNSLADRITAVAGNCDGDREQAALLFPLHEDYALLNTPTHRFFLTHGDRWSPSRLPPAGVGEVFCFGHSHVPMLHRLPDGLVLFNPRHGRGDLLTRKR